MSTWVFELEETVRRYNQGDRELLDGIAAYLAELDLAKQKLKNAGYGPASLSRMIDEAIAERQGI